VSSKNREQLSLEKIMVWQIIRKEIWHNKHWMGLALGFVLFFTIVIYIDQTEYARHFNSRNYAVNSKINIWELYNNGVNSISMRGFSAIYFFAAVGLGILIAVSQFWVPFFTNTWKFTLHRPIKRGKMLMLMFTSAAFMIALIAGGSWTILWLKGRAEFSLPPTFTSLAEGWLFTLEGFIAYLAIALAALSEERWYTTKLVPLLFALLTWIAIWMSITFTSAFIITGIYMAIVMPLIYRKFETREF
jgi:hypothetical protein